MLGDKDSFAPEFCPSAIFRMTLPALLRFRWDCGGTQRGLDFDWRQGWMKWGRSSEAARPAGKRMGEKGPPYRSRYFSFYYSLLAHHHTTEGERQRETGGISLPSISHWTIYLHPMWAAKHFLTTNVPQWHSDVIPYFRMQQFLILLFIIVDLYSSRWGRWLP